LLHVKKAATEEHWGLAAFLQQVHMFFNKKSKLRRFEIGFTLKTTALTIGGFPENWGMGQAPFFPQSVKFL